MALLMTVVVGLFILIGAAIVFLNKKTDNIIQFSISMAFGVIVALVGLELFPESYEILNENFENLGIILLVGFILLGIVILKLLDLFIPDHEIEDNTEESKTENLYHIGIMSSVALILHNIIEGMAIYSTASSSTELGILITIGVGLHNIPMGLIVTSTLYDWSKNKKKTLLILLVIALSTFLGGLIMHFLSSIITELLLGVLLAITMGMLIYISFFELLPELKNSKNKKVSILGIILGVLVFLISILFE